MPVEYINQAWAGCELDFVNGVENCDWEWYSGPLEDASDGEVELCVHMLNVHGLKRELPNGYEYKQEDLDRKLKGEI